MAFQQQNFYSLIIVIHSPASAYHSADPRNEKYREGTDWRLGEFSVDWVDFTREKSVDRKTMGKDDPVDTANSSKNNNMESKPKSTSQGRNMQGFSHVKSKNSQQSKSKSSSKDNLSLQPLLGHFPSPSPLSSSYAQGISSLGTGVIHLFKHSPPPSLIASIDSHPDGQSSKDQLAKEGEWDGDSAEGADGSLVAILAVPAWMRPADFLEFIGGWGTCLEGVRMIREAATPNRSIVLLKFRDALQAQDFMVIFTGRAFSALDSRETCHPIRIHHLVLHKIDSDQNQSKDVAVPAFPPSVYNSRVRQLPQLLTDIPADSRYELPSCPVCLERLDSTVTGLVTLPCAHTFDCDCLRKWGDSRCPVCRLSHLLLSTSSSQACPPPPGRDRHEITRLTKCSICSITDNNWICVVCGVVGCGRYEPGKGHARKHWEESGHALAMELETQRVWDYKGDNYVHRLIQTKNDGKLVELPSASSLTTPSAPRSMPLGNQRDSSVVSENQGEIPRRENISEENHAGPSLKDEDKISAIESITLEYSYLLSSQLESMRQHYESNQTNLAKRLEELEKQNAENINRLRDLEKADKEREKAEKKAEKVVKLSQGLQSALGAEKAITEGLSERIKVLEKERDEAINAKMDKYQECQALEETVRDLMFSLEAGQKVKEMGGDGGEGGDLMVVSNRQPAKGKKKNKK
ncbi:uncharacterized protein L203_105282 [Cryptococcus depauperatus CBS 7841]|uniref:Uncharacterized protein n=1 Tax=Cryptococcus depauperatus CBS 7841 TaxID=1295531 RepID=A0A1E3HYY2_9TREE|nr:BRCA1-associated protein [Cryptococcus depauperatus CBS 7841]